MTEFLISGQEDAQLLAARAVATVLHNRSDLFEYLDDVTDSAIEQSSLYVYPLNYPLQVDGYGTDWATLLDKATQYGRESTHYLQGNHPGSSTSFSLILGEHQDYLYGFLRITDKHVIYRHPKYRRLDNSDHVRLAWINPEGGVKRVLLTTEGIGTVTAYEVQDNWRYDVTGKPLHGWYGEWRERHDGYDLEFRLPKSWLGKQPRLMISVVDVNDDIKRHPESIVSTLPQQWSNQLNRLIIHSPLLERILKGLDRSDDRICVVDRYKRVRAVFGGEESHSDLCKNTDTVSNALVRDALNGKQKVILRNGETATDETLIVAANPIYGDGNNVVGAVLLEKDRARIISRQRSALNNLVIATLLVFMLVSASLFLFGGRLAFRIRRLKSETSNAIDPEGRVLNCQIEAECIANDDLGDLSREISDILGRLRRYTGFLETVPRTLRHEILNPVNTINLSLQALSSGNARNPNEACISSARRATYQLEMIVNSLTEAAHIEEALKSDEQEIFDIAMLASEYAENVRQHDKKHTIKYQGPQSGIKIIGSDLRIAQLLDKVKDNAIDFTEEGKEICFEVTPIGSRVELTIRNEGPRIPEDVLESLFLGMTSHRPGDGRKPHLGIGLFIAQRIALYHGGSLTVANRQDVSGVKVILQLPCHPTEHTADDGKSLA